MEIKRLIKKSDESSDIKKRDNINKLKEAINRLNRDLNIERQDLEDVIDVKIMGDLALNIIDQAKRVEELCYNTTEGLENNPEANDYIYELIENIVKPGEVWENAMDSKYSAKVVVDFIDKVLQLNSKFLK